MLKPGGKRRPGPGRSSRRARSSTFSRISARWSQFPLTTTIPVVRGDVIALTTPTWAPVLSIDLATNSSPTGRAGANCYNPPATSQAQVTVGQNAATSCDYPGTRVEYTATEVTNPVASPTTKTKPPTKKK